MSPALVRGLRYSVFDSLRESYALASRRKIGISGTIFVVFPCKMNSEIRSLQKFTFPSSTTSLFLMASQSNRERLYRERHVTLDAIYFLYTDGGCYSSRRNFLSPAPPASVRNPTVSLPSPAFITVSFRPDAAARFQRKKKGRLLVECVPLLLYDAPLSGRSAGRITRLQNPFAAVPPNHGPGAGRHLASEPCTAFHLP